MTLTRSATGLVLVAFHACSSQPSRGPSATSTTASAVTAPLATLVGDPPDSMGHNGLSSHALLHNALTVNRRSLQILSSRPLSSALFDDSPDGIYLKQVLSEAPAQAVMTDLVACALGASSPHVKYGGNDWAGELGLCTPEPGKDRSTHEPAEDWSKYPPTKRCLQLVSACLFARVNGLYRRVPISLHGPRELPALRPRVAVETRYRDGKHQALNEGAPIESFRRSTVASGACPKGEECGGWLPGYVGTCAPPPSSQDLTSFPQVTVSFQASPPCPSAAVRPCKGVYGCEEDPKRTPIRARSYSAAIHPSMVSQCSYEFLCPQEGSYALMFKPAIYAVTVDTGTYPAAETDVFAFHEGAFFGNLFDPDQLRYEHEVRIAGQPPPHEISLEPGTPDDELARQVPYKRMYACYSLPLAKEIEQHLHQDEKAGAEYLNDRICAIPGSKCFLNPPRRCQRNDGKHSAHCTWRTDQQAYGQCQGDGDDTAFYPPITTYLDSPCSLLDDDQCRVLKTMLDPQRITGRPAAASP